MDAWPVNVRIFVVSVYIESKSVVQTQRRFRREFNVQRHGRIPSRNTIVSWFNMFNARGTLQPSFHGSGRYVRTPENIQRVRLAVQRSPSRSAVRHAAALRISDRTVRRILHKDLKFHPYKIQVAQQLKPQARASRLNLEWNLVPFFKKMIMC